MTRFLDWLDESAAGLIRIAYLLAGVIAVASYFSDGNVPRQFSAVLNAILPWALAAALEIHTYLTARRVRQAWQDWSAAAVGSDEHERAKAQMQLNLWILSALLAFSMYNQLQYLAATWTPPHTPLTPPGPWAYLIRAIITPAAFMAAAFLAPVGEGLALQVQSQAHALAVATFKVATQQWKRRLKQMQQAGQDVTGALVQLVDDPAERRVIEAIWQAMQHPALPAAISAATPAASSPATPAATPAVAPAAKPTAKRQEEQPPATPAEPAEQPAPTPAVAPTVAPTQAPIPLQPRTPRAPQTEREPERQPALSPAARQSARQSAPRRGLGRVGLPAPSSRASGRGEGMEESAPPAISDEPAPNADRPAADRVDLRRQREEAARRVLAENPTITAAELARRIAMATRTRIGESTARGIRDAVLAERQTPPPLRVIERVIEGYATEAPADESAEDADGEELRRN